MVRFDPRPLYRGEILPVMLWAGGRPGPRTGMDALKKESFVASIGNRTYIPRSLSPFPVRCIDFAV